MSGAQHTPGPWSVKSDPCHFDTLSDIHAGGKLIAQTCSEYPSLEANARLIAAAPDLLAALEKLEYWLDSDPEVLAAMNALERDDHLAKLELARAAIAKAKGAAE